MGGEIMAAFTIFPILIFLVYLFLIGLSIYVMYLVIKALRIYIKKNS